MQKKIANCVNCKHLKKHFNKWARYTCPFAPNKEYWGKFGLDEIIPMCGNYEPKLVLPRKVNELIKGDKKNE